MNPYLKSTSLSPNPKFSSHLGQSLSSRPLAESGYYTPVNPNTTNFSPFIPPHVVHVVEDQAYYRGGHGVSRANFSASMGPRPVNSRSSITEFVPPPPGTIIYTSEVHPVSKPQVSVRSSSVQRDSATRREPYTRVFQPSEHTIVQTHVEPVETPQPHFSIVHRTPDDHKANLEKLQAIIDSAKARQASLQNSSQNYASEPRSGYTNTPTDSRSQYRSLTYAERNPELIQALRGGPSGQPESYSAGTDRYGSLGRSLHGMGVPQQTPKDLSSSQGPTSSQSALLHSKDSAASNYYSGLGTKAADYNRQLAASSTVRNEPLSQIPTQQNKEQIHNNGFSFRDSSGQNQQETKNESPYSAQFGSVQAAPKETRADQRKNLAVPPPERFASVLTQPTSEASSLRGMQTPPEGLIRREQHNPQDFHGSPLRRYQLEDRAYENGLLSSASESSISKKTFYTIENSNSTALQAFKNTVAELSARTPEKNKTTLADVQSPFEDLQFALNKDNVQISRIIIETVENYSSPSSHKRIGSESQRGETSHHVAPVQPIQIRDQISPTTAEILKEYGKQQPTTEEKRYSNEPARAEEQKKPTPSELSQFESRRESGVSKIVHETPKTELKPGDQRRSIHQAQAPTEEYTQPETREHAPSYSRAESLRAQIKPPTAEENRQNTPSQSGLEQFEVNREKFIPKAVHETPKTEPKPPAQQQTEQERTPVFSENVQREPLAGSPLRTQIKPPSTEVPREVPRGPQVQTEESRSSLQQNESSQEARADAWSRIVERDISNRAEPSVDYQKREGSVRDYSLAGHFPSEREPGSRNILDSQRDISGVNDSRNELGNQLESEDVRRNVQEAPSFTNEDYKPSVVNADQEKSNVDSRIASRSELSRNTPVKPRQEEEEEVKSYPEPRKEPEPEKNVIRQREVVSQEPEPQLLPSKQEVSNKKAVTPEVGEVPEKKKSNLAVKAVIGFLVVLLLGLLGMEIVFGENVENA